MNFIITIILPYIILYKYFAIFIITLVAAFAFPIPPGTLLMASSAFASQGYFSLFWIIVIGSLGNIVGDNIGYWLARYYGKQVLNKIGFRKTIESEKYLRIEKRLRRNPGIFIFLTRFEVFSNLAVNIMCGLGKIQYRKYLFFEVIGEVAQVSLYCTIGYLVGDNWHAVSKLISQLLLLLLLIFALFIIIFWRKIWKKKN